MLFIIAFIVSFIPYIALFLWLRKVHRDDFEYKRLCNRTLGRGILSVLSVILISGILFIPLRLTGVQNSNPLLYAALYNGIVLALVEEIVKYRTFHRVLNKMTYAYSWLDVTILMTIVGIGFGFIEAVIYSIGASIPVVLVRGICLPHAGYGFVVGFFCGKGIKYEKPVYKWLGFLIAWFMHALYDFSLSEEFVALNEYLMIISLLLAVMDIVLVIILIVFVNKAKKREIYTESLTERPDTF